MDIGIATRPWSTNTRTSMTRIISISTTRTGMWKSPIPTPTDTNRSSTLTRTTPIYIIGMTIYARTDAVVRKLHLSAGAAVQRHGHKSEGRNQGLSDLDHNRQCL